VTDAAGQILTRGRNRIWESQAETGELFGQTLAHAEVNALIKLPVHGRDRHSCALYTTLEPCPLCMGAFYMSGVRQLHYAARDPFAGSVNLLGATPYLSRKPVKVSGPDRPELEILIMALHTEFELRQGAGEGVQRLLEVWAAAVPEGVRLGEALFESGELDRLREQGMNIEQVISRLLE
jgi:tRNA(Arg) A34 adenosine deaminase TadA